MGDHLESFCRQWMAAARDESMRTQELAHQMAAAIFIPVTAGGSDFGGDDGDCPICYGERTVWSEAVVEGLAEVVYEAEEQQRAKEDGEPGVWVPWKSQTSRREQRVARTVARAALDAIWAKLKEAGGG